MKFLIILFLLISCSEPQNEKLISLNSTNYDEAFKVKNNKAVLINLWATWCAPCIEEFPHIVALRKKYQDKLEVVFISLDDPENKEAVLDFLDKMNVDFPSYINTGADQEFISVMPNDFYGAIPYTIIKNKDGEIVEQIMGKHSYSDFEQKIQSAIK